jgi:hypothetical protein
MNLNSLFVVNFILALVFGLGLMFVPSTISDLYAAELTPAGAFMGQLFGACLIGFAILSWFARGIAEFATRQVFAMMFLVGYVLAFVISLIAQTKGVLNNLGWVNVVAYALLALGFAYFRFTKKTKS